jgi:hypothetical protein
MTEKIVTFEGDPGKWVNYTRYAARLPAFLESYSPQEGYRVEIERTDLLALQAGRLSLMREAVIAGKKPSDVGLPGIEDDVRVLVCTSKLLDAQKRVLRSASAAMALMEEMDFRVLETAANQRLIAALGFGGTALQEPVPLEEDVLYRTYAARLPAFLKAYSPKVGYRVEIGWTDLLSLQTGRLSLLREAILAGRKPDDVGLPGIEADVNKLVCTARLLDPQGQVVRTGGASMEIVEHKDFEKLETAANQRLLAALGYGGEVFDEDEDTDLRAQGISTFQSSSTATDGAMSVKAASSGLQSSDVLGDSHVGGPETSDDTEEAFAAERKQIENLARRLGAAVPAMKTRGDVKRARQALSAADRQRRSSARSSTQTATN